ncbi:MAG: DUF4332 domain-containing protein [Candidatus Bathyarchaeota archaeon]|nr:MAG: DUF4332 domain-containing protein [Candidatus Bathyarchaeota archaeon]
MEIDWNIVKKMTLWDYENLIKKILKVLSYNFVQEHYNHSLREAGTYVKKMLGYDPKYEEYASNITNILKKIESLKVENYIALVRRVETRQKCEEFVRRAKLPFMDLISALNYIFRWVLPFRNVYLRQLVETSNEVHMEYIKRLKEHDIELNLDILEHGRTKEARIKLLEETVIPEDFILYIVNRADLTRLPYMSRKTVNHLCAGGYDSVDKLVQAESGKVIEDMKAYFDKIGVKLSGFIDLKGITHWAKTIPKIVET